MLSSGFYVVEGELTFRLGDQVVIRGPGETAFAPRRALGPADRRGRE